MPPRIKLDIVVDKKTGKMETFVLEGVDAIPLMGHKLGDVIDGGVIKRPGQKFKIVGGSDTSGFPMLKGVHGPGKRQILLSKGKGARRAKKGELIRATVVGEQISEEIAQINLVKIE